MHTLVRSALALWARAAIGVNDALWRTWSPDAEDEPDQARHERGQTTAEYALVLLGAATVAMLLIAWAGSTGRVSGLFDRVFDAVTNRVT